MESQNKPKSAISERVEEDIVEPSFLKSEVDGTRDNQTDASLEALREILFSQYRRQIAELEIELDELERRISDKDAFVAMVTPVLGSAIQRKIRDAREEMIEVFYPIIGEAVARAVADAIRDLARKVDAQMRTTFDLQSWGRRLTARVGGVSSAELALRESLPFQVAEIFLIHRETGLLLRQVSRDSDRTSDSDIVSGMLTAIRDFVKESFGRGGDDQLKEIEYGDRHILLETGQYAYLAVVSDGIEPPGFRTELRDRLYELDRAYDWKLRDYDGDPTALAPAEEALSSLITDPDPPQLSTGQKRVLAGVGGLVAVCALTTCLVGLLGWQMFGNNSTVVPVVLVPTLTPTLTQTASPSPTPTNTPAPTATPAFTATPTATPTPTPTVIAIPTLTVTATATSTPVQGLMTGDVSLHRGPATGSPRTGVILERGQSVELLSVFGNWYRVRWAQQQPAIEVVGWVPARWVIMVTPIPARIITPTTEP